MELLPPGELKTPVTENLTHHAVVLTPAERHGAVIQATELHEPRGKTPAISSQPELDSERLNNLAVNHHDEPESEGSVVVNLLP